MYVLRDRVAGTTEVVRRGEGEGLTFAQWATAVLYNGFARYGWKIVDGGGSEILRGVDVVERATDGRLRRIVMFFGELESS